MAHRYEAEGVDGLKDRTRANKAAVQVDGSMIDSTSNVMAVKLYANLAQEISYIDKEIQQVVINDRRLQWRNLKINFGQGLG